MPWALARVLGYAGSGRRCAEARKRQSACAGAKCADAFSHARTPSHVLSFAPSHTHLERPRRPGRRGQRVSQGGRGRRAQEGDQRGAGGGRGLAADAVAGRAATARTAVVVDQGPGDGVEGHVRGRVCLPVARRARASEIDNLSMCSAFRSLSCPAPPSTRHPRSVTRSVRVSQVSQKFQLSSSCSFTFMHRALE